MKTLIYLVLLMAVAAFTVSVYAQTDPASDDNLVYITAVSWNNDGTKIAAVGVQPPGIRGYLRVLDTTTGQLLYQFDPTPGGFTSVAWSPNNRFIAAGGFDQVIHVIDVEARQQVATLSGHRATVTSVDWNKDGTQLVSSGNWDELVILWDMATYRQIQSIEIGDPWSVEFSPNGQRIAVGGLAGLFVFPSNLEITKSEGKNQYKYSDKYVSSLAWSHDGSRIAFSDQMFTSALSKSVGVQLYIVNSTNGTQLSNFLAGEKTLHGIDWSPDDNLIATHSIDGFVKIWEVKSGTQMQSFAGTTRYPEKLDFSPYGGRLAYGTTLPVSEVISTSSSQTAGSAIQIIVPAPSLEKLQAITERCKAQPAVQQALTAQIQSKQLTAFIQQVSALTDAQILPGCKADLLAVAQALQAKQ